MTLTEVTPVPVSALPVAVLRDHLRMGGGFADDAVQDPLLEAYLRAALAAIEGRIGKALIARTFLWTLARWRDGLREAFPVAPVSAVTSVTVKDRAGAATVVPGTAWLLLRDGMRPELAANGGSLPPVPDLGVAEVVFTGGFGAWAQVPVDLAQAAFLLAAHYHENRHATGEIGAGIPFGVMALIERWRVVRISGGAA